MLKKIVLIILVGSFLFAVTDNKEVTVNFRPIVPKLKCQNPTVGSHLYYSFYIKDFPFQPSFNLQFSDPSQNENIMIVTQNIIKKGKNNFSFKAEIVPFQTGVIKFPSFNILNLAIQPVAVTISSVISNGTTVNLQESYPPYQDYSDIILIVFVLLVLAGVYYLYKNYLKKKKEQLEVITPQKAKNLWQELSDIFKQGIELPQVKSYYFNSSEKLKYFVSKVLNVEILELTSLEISKLLKNSKLKNKENLSAALDSAELVKFAKYQPSIEEIKKYQQTALKFLEVHQPQTEEEQSDGQ